jgi:hypothetical protein
MDNKERVDLIALYGAWTDETLERAWTVDRGQYRQEALELMEQELRRRSMSTAAVPESVAQDLRVPEKKGSRIVDVRMADLVRGFKPEGIAAASGGAILRRAWAAIGVALFVWYIFAIIVSCTHVHPSVRDLVFWGVVITSVAGAVYIAVMMVVGTWKFAMRIPFLLLALPVFAALALGQLILLFSFVGWLLFGVGLMVYDVH